MAVTYMYPHAWYRCNHIGGGQSADQEKNKVGGVKTASESGLRKSSNPGFTDNEIF
jgi:hypothetical protein